MESNQKPKRTTTKVQKYTKKSLNPIISFIQSNRILIQCLHNLPSTEELERVIKKIEIGKKTSGVYSENLYDLLHGPIDTTKSINKLTKKDLKKTLEVCLELQQVWKTTLESNVSFIPHIIQALNKITSL